MFDIGWIELVLVAVAALVLVGPKDLPAMLRRLGQMMGTLRRQAHEFRQALEEMDRPHPPRPRTPPWPQPDPASEESAELNETKAKAEKPAKAKPQPKKKTEKKKSQPS